MSETAAAAMPQYRSHKKVWALKVGDQIGVNPDGSVVLTFADGGFSPKTIAKEVVSRYLPSPGDYYVVYEDGYESISPAKAFEDGYTRI